jgi:hypothetical protein
MDFKELKAYQKAFDLAMEVFELTKCFPKEERYALIDATARILSCGLHISKSY